MQRGWNKNNPKSEVMVNNEVTEDRDEIVEHRGEVLRPLLLGGMRKSVGQAGRAERKCMLVQELTTENDDKMKKVDKGSMVAVPHWKRMCTRVWSYSVQSMTDSRTWEISKCFHEKGLVSFVGIQGTQKKYGKGQLRVEQWSTRYHDIWDLRQKKQRMTENTLLELQSWHLKVTRIL